MATAVARKLHRRHRRCSRYRLRRTRRRRNRGRGGGGWMRRMGIQVDQLKEPLGLSDEQVTQLEAINVPEQILNNFTERVMPLFELMDSLTLRIQNLRRTRDLLLPRLISGQLNVEELDLNVGAVPA